MFAIGYMSVLRFLDDQQAWEPNDFAKFTMHTVMFSVQVSSVV